MAQIELVIQTVVFRMAGVSGCCVGAGLARGFWLGGEHFYNFILFYNGWVIMAKKVG